MPAFCNNSRGVVAFTCFIIASSTRPAASASAWAWWWLNSWPICAVKVLRAVVWQFRPDAPGELTGANIIKLRSGQTEMIQGGAQMFDVEGGVMRNHEVGAGQPGQKFRRNGGKFRGIQNIQMRQAVTFNEVFVKPAVAFGWPHQPIWRLRQFAILKDGQPGGADAHARGIGRFKVEAGEIHGLREFSDVFCEPRGWVLGAWWQAQQVLQLENFRTDFFIRNYKIGLCAQINS